MWEKDFALSFCIPLLAVLGWPVTTHFKNHYRVEMPSSLCLAMSYAVALAYIQCGGMILGFIHFLHPLGSLVWLALGILASAVIWIRLDRPWPSSKLKLSPPLVLGSVLGIIYLLMATVPAWMRDEMTYHLALPRAFAVQGGYVQPDDNIFAAFPLGWESILAILHSLGSPPDYFAPFNPRLLGAWTIMATTLAIVGLARTISIRPNIASWCGVLWLLIPTVFEFGSSAYVEPYLVLSSTLALAFCLRVIANEKSFLYPACFFAGVAASTKYPGLAVGFFLGILLVFNGLRRSPEEARKSLSQAFSFFVFSFLIASPFYLRNWLQRDNPIFPLAYELLGGKGWDSWRSWAYAETLAHYGKGRDMIDYLLLPFRLFTTRSLFREFEGSLGPVVGIGASILFIFSKNKKLAGPLKMQLLNSAGFALFWSVLWAITVQQIRFYLVAVPAWLALLLWQVQYLEKKWSMRASKVLLGSMIALSLFWFFPLGQKIWNRQHTSQWLLHQIDRQTILSRLLPESYALEKDLESLVLPSGKIWLVWMRAHTYYLRRSFREDMVFEAYRFEDLLDRASLPTIHQSLNKDQITHILIHHQFFLWNNNADLTPGRTDNIRQKFENLIRTGILHKKRQWGEIALYSVEKRSPNQLGI